MRFEPQDLSHNYIMKNLAIHYGLKVGEITFLPLGEDGWVYQVIAKDGGRWFLKVSERIVEAGVAVPAFLHDTLEFPFVPKVMQSLSGDMYVRDNGLTYVVSEYIEGQVLASLSDDSHRYEIGRYLKLLHESATALPKPLQSLIPPETFDRHWAEATKVIDTCLEKHIGQYDEIAQKLCAFVATNKDTIAIIMERARTLGKSLKKQDVPFVLCHADIHTSNILVDASNILHFVDWDGVMLAPSERDLSFYTDGLKVQGAVLAGYGSNFVANEELFTYYKYEWVVQEFADYGGDILFGDYSDEQKEHALESFKELFEPVDVVEGALAYNISNT